MDFGIDQAEERHFVSFQLEPSRHLVRNEAAE